VLLGLASQANPPDLFHQGPHILVFFIIVPGTEDMSSALIVFKKTDDASSFFSELRPLW
jgi:hypothetical protein